MTGHDYDWVVLGFGFGGSPQRARRHRDARSPKSLERGAGSLPARSQPEETKP